MSSDSVPRRVLRTTSEELAFRQTGLEGPPREPFVVGLGVISSESIANGAICSIADGVRSRLESIRQEHRDRGWLTWDRWILLTATPDGRQRTFVYDDGVVDEERWRDAAQGIPGRYDHLVLSADP